MLVGGLLICGAWPVTILKRSSELVRSGSYLPWNTSIGWLAAPTILLALCLPVDRPSKLAAVSAAGMLPSPYLPYYSTLLLLVFPLPLWLYPLAFLGYLPGLIGTALAWNRIVLLQFSLWLLHSIPVSTRQIAGELIQITDKHLPLRLMG